MRLFAVAAPSLALSIVLTGCAIAPTASPSLDHGLALQGKVHGGQQPIVGAHVYLLAANTTGSALTTTPAGNGTVPQQTINTLANILASCINSTGPTIAPVSASSRMPASRSQVPADTPRVT